MDDEHIHWVRKRELLPDNVVEVLDLWHVMDRQWDVAKRCMGRKIPRHGNSLQNARGRSWRATSGELSAVAQIRSASTITYFSTNRMRYDYQQFRIKREQTILYTTTLTTAADELRPSCLSLEAWTSGQVTLSHDSASHSC
jgi:hypothetical protein